MMWAARSLKNASIQNGFGSLYCIQNSKSILVDKTKKDVKDTKKDVKEISLYLKPGNPPDNAGDFIKWLANHKRVHAFVFTENWFDIGSFENLGKAREEFNG